MPSGSRQLLAGFRIRQGTKDLRGNFVARHGSAVPLSASLNVRHRASRDLGASLNARHRASANLLSQLNVVHWRSLIAGFIVRHSASTDFKAGFLVMHWKGLTTVFKIRRTRSRVLESSFYVKPSYTPPLPAGFEARHSSLTEFKGGFLSLQESSTALSSRFLIRNPDSIFFKGSFEIRKPAGSNLHSVLEITRSRDLKAGFRAHVIAPPSEEVLIDDDIDDWMNYYDCIGTGFIDRPSHENDPIVKASGVDSFKINSDFHIARFKEITFGWSTNPLDTCADMKVWIAGGEEFPESPLLKRFDPNFNGFDLDLSTAVKTYLSSSWEHVSFARVYDGILYIGGSKGHLVTYNLETGVWTNHTSKFGLTSSDSISGIIFNGYYFLVTAWRGYTPTATRIWRWDGANSVTSLSSAFEAATGFTNVSIFSVEWSPELDVFGLITYSNLDAECQMVVGDPDGWTVLARPAGMTRPFVLGTYGSLDYFLVAYRKAAGVASLYRVTPTTQDFIGDMDGGGWITPMKISCRDSSYMTIACYAENAKNAWIYRRGIFFGELILPSASDTLTACDGCGKWAFIGGSKFTGGNYHARLYYRSHLLGGEWSDAGDSFFTPHPDYEPVIDCITPNQNWRAT